jgi:ATP/ADP translocase
MRLERELMFKGVLFAIFLFGNAIAALFVIQGAMRLSMSGGTRFLPAILVLSLLAIVMAGSLLAWFAGGTDGWRTAAAFIAGAPVMLVLGAFGVVGAIYLFFGGSHH